MSRDTIALLASFAYVFAAIGIAEGLRKWLGQAKPDTYSVEFTRKFIHIAVGMWTYGTVLLFERRTFAIIPPLAFVAINTFSYWQGTFKAMETGEKGQLVAIYFPISFAMLIWLLWRRSHLLVASLMPMTWGVGPTGRRAGRRGGAAHRGQRRYTVESRRVDEERVNEVLVPHLLIYPPTPP